MHRHLGKITLILLILASLSVSCGDDKPTKPEPSGNPAAVVPDFTLADRNPNSPTFEADISPRNYLGKVSCYYFTAAT
jgi:hypothetical protein